MAERQRGSQWYSTPTEARKRPPVKLSLSPEGRAALEAEQADRGLASLSATVETLVLEARAARLAAKKK